MWNTGEEHPGKSSMLSQRSMTHCLDESGYAISELAFKKLILNRVHEVDCIDDNLQIPKIF
jgi:hypothetical protein